VDEERKTELLVRLDERTQRLDERTEEIRLKVDEFAAVKLVVQENGQSIGSIQETLKRHNINGAAPKRGALLLAWMPIVKQVVHFSEFAIMAALITAGIINIDALTTLWNLAQGQLGAAP